MPKERKNLPDFDALRRNLNPLEEVTTQPVKTGLFEAKYFDKMDGVERTGWRLNLPLQDILRSVWIHNHGFVRLLSLPEETVVALKKYADEIDIEIADLDNFVAVSITGYNIKFIKIGKTVDEASLRSVEPGKILFINRIIQDLVFGEEVTVTSDVQHMTRQENEILGFRSNTIANKQMLEEVMRGFIDLLSE